LNFVHFNFPFSILFNIIQDLNIWILNEYLE
jgi:hypothetical protein